MNLQYYWTKLFKKIHGKAISNSQIDKTSKIEAKSEIKQSNSSNFSNMFEN